jgi:acyl carrier protein
MMEREAIEQTVYDFVAHELLEGDAEGLTVTTNLLRLGIIDSLAVVTLRVFIQRSFGVHLPDGMQPDDFTTVSAIAAVVDELQRAAGGAA